MYLTKKKMLFSLVLILIVALSVWAWRSLCSTTRIAFVNYQVITLGEIAKANDNSFIRISEVGTEELDGLGRYDMVFINAMGLRITAEQRALIQQAADKGTPILTTAATNPANLIVSIDEWDADSLKQYLTGGGRRNYRSMLNYVRNNIDCKLAFTQEPEPAESRAAQLLYHPSCTDPDGEEEGFNSIAAYEAYLKKHGLLKEGAPAVIVTGQMGEPTDLIRRLEATGNNVYAVRNMNSLVRQQRIDSIRPAAVINMAHGRMGDYIVDYLTRQNIPLFTTVNVNRLTEEWEADKQGMNGGFLSQSIVTPEIDGAIRPFVLFAHRRGKDGLQEAYTIPERLESFVKAINNYIALKKKANAEKRVAIVYFKGPGQNALTASGLEVVPSLYNLLVRLRQEGYRVDGLPASAEELGKLINRQGAVFGTYAEGAQSRFLTEGKPELVTREQYDTWAEAVLTPASREEMTRTNGEFPGRYLATNDGRLGISRIQLGNIVLLPQPPAGGGDDSFKMVHGTDAAPPYPYVAAYLWLQEGFKADALIHFGTHGSLEYTPRKQVALSADDWSDRLIGSTPHFYIYTIGNVGEAMIAKRRSYAGIQSYLTPPFMESSLRTTYNELSKAIDNYNRTLESKDSKAGEQAARTVKQLTLKLGIHRELGLDSIAPNGYTEEEIARIEEFAEELANEKITGQLYTLGVPYETERIHTSVYAMATDPIAYSLLALDKQKKRAADDVEKHKALFTRRYLEPARQLVTRLLANPALATDEFICQTARITPQELQRARRIDSIQSAPQDMMTLMQNMAGEMPGTKGQGSHVDASKPSSKPESKAQQGPTDEQRKKMQEMGKGMDPKKALAMAKMMGATPEQLKKMKEGMMKGKKMQDPHTGKAGSMSPAMKAMMEKLAEKASLTKEEIAFARTVSEVERTIRNVNNYRQLLLTAPETELSSLMNALSGGYTPPSPGGDAIANPNALPTGRNLFGINAETTPSEAAWEKGKELAENTIRMYRQRHNDSIPRKVSYTLWSSEFIETEGATIAQVLYMLGVEPVRDAFGRVTDLRLIPSKELGRPRIDVVVQTSGQLRDLAASRLFLISRAVEMAAAAKDDQFENQVAAGVVEAERTLIAKGLSPKEAREVSTYRVFGGVNGNYGTGIQEMTMAGDRWDKESELAEVYLNNMGAFYGSEKNWEQVRQFAFEAALTHTDAVIQPRQSNTWGALSLDHVYEFMGGMNMAVRNVTGKDPDAYLSDYRNRNRARMQEVKEAIGVESRTTLFNPAYIREKMKGDASAAAGFAELIQNTYGWNVMKPQAIDRQMWDGIYETYVKDKNNLGVKEFFEQKNPAALQEMTAVMLETVRKGMWKASAQQIKDIAELHTELVNKYEAGCSGMVCDNAKLREFISQNVSAQQAQEYTRNISKARQEATSDDKGMVMKKEELNAENNQETNTLSNVAVGLAVLLVIIGLIVWVKRKSAKMKKEE